MADRSDSSCYTSAICSENFEVHQYLEHASDGNCRVIIDDKSTKSSQLEHNESHNNIMSAMEIQDVPRSGVRRRNVPVNMLSSSEDIQHKIIRPKGRIAWLRARELLKRQIPKEESSKKYGSSLDCNDENIRLEKVVETICKEQCFQRNLAVKALPDDTSQQNTVLLVTRSFEVNPTMREKWSVLKEAVSSGEIREAAEDENERSGLRRLSLYPRKRVDDKVEISSRQGHSGWPKIKAMIDKKLLRRSSKSGVIDDWDSCSQNSDESGVAVDEEKTSGAGLNTNEIELYTDVSSTVQALPIDTVGKDEVVSVTRSFEYNRTWINEQAALRRLSSGHEEGENVPLHEKSNRVATKDACCQTDFGSGKIFEHYVMKQLSYEACRSEFEEGTKEKANNVVRYVWMEDRAGINEDECNGSNALLEKDEGGRYMGNGRDSRMDHLKSKREHNDMRLVKDKFPKKEAVSILQEEGDEETNENLVNSFHEEKRGPSDTQKIEKHVYEVGFFSPYFEKEEQNNNIPFEIMPKEHESGLHVTKRTSIPEEGYSCKTVDTFNASDGSKWKENPNELETSNVYALATQSIDEPQISAFEQKENEVLSGANDAHNGERAERLEADLMMKPANVKKGSPLEGVRRPCNPVAITAKFIDHKQPLLKHVQIVKAVRSIELEPWAISYV